MSRYNVREKCTSSRDDVYSHFKRVTRAQETAYIGYRHIPYRDSSFGVDSQNPANSCYYSQNDFLIWHICDIICQGFNKCVVGGIAS